MLQSWRTYRIIIGKGKSYSENYDTVHIHKLSFHKRFRLILQVEYTKLIVQKSLHVFIYMFTRE